MLDRFKRDPVKRAKRHIEKALEELEEDYPDYASTEYEKAARLFLEAEEIDFAVKYFREAAICALHKEDHQRAAVMKLAAAEVFLSDKRYSDAGNLYSESSDHQFRMKQVKDSSRSLGVSILTYLAARHFDTAVNLLRKAEKRIENKKSNDDPMLTFARLCVAILVDGRDIEHKEVDKAFSASRPSNMEQNVVNFVNQSVRLALQTDVIIEWAGREPPHIRAKNPLEFELRYTCPVPVRVVECTHNLSNNLRMTRPAQMSGEARTDESWLLEVVADISGDATVGPFRFTLEGDAVLVHKPSNIINFRVERAPSDLKMDLTPKVVSCSLGDEVVFDVHLQNEGDGPADNVNVVVDISDGLEVSLGSREKIIEFIGSGEKMRIQVYVRPVVSMGDEKITVRVQDARSDTELSMSSEVKVS